MYVHESGSIKQPAILFLHGNGANGSMWKSHMARLVDYHCLAPDFPGYGRSNGQEWVSLAETATQISEIIRQCSATGRAHLVGLSLGGSVVLTLLNQAPEVIDHAIVDGAGVLPLPGLPLMKVGFRLLQPFLHTDFVIRTIGRSMAIPTEEMESFKQGMLAMSPASFTRSFLQALSLRQPPGLAQVTCPTLFVAGEKEPAAVHQSNRMLAEIMPHAQSCLAPGMAHGWLAESPTLHCQMVEAWLNDAPLPQKLIEVKISLPNDRSPSSKANSPPRISPEHS